MPVIITITNKPTSVELGGPIYDYAEYDRILKNICTNEYEVFYSGQKKGGLDNQLLTAIGENDRFMIYYRPKTSMPFKYLGETRQVDIIQYRTNIVGINAEYNERLQIHLKVINIINTQVPENNFTGSGKYKKDILVHRGLRDINDESIIEHNRNTNIGFYKY